MAAGNLKDKVKPLHSHGGAPGQVRRGSSREELGDACCLADSTRIKRLIGGVNVSWLWDARIYYRGCLDVIIISIADG